MFRLDASTSHQNLRVDELSVEWDAMGGKVQDIKAREKDGKGRTASPVNSPARYPPPRVSGRGGQDGVNTQPRVGEAGWREGRGAGDPK